MAREEDMLKTRLANLEAERPALEALYNTMEQRDLAAGSPLARRLFS